jgi:hypothetical protein
MYVVENIPINTNILLNQINLSGVFDWTNKYNNSKLYTLLDCARSMLYDSMMSTINSFDYCNYARYLRLIEKMIYKSHDSTDLVELLFTMCLVI